MQTGSRGQVRKLLNTAGREQGLGSELIGHVREGAGRKVRSGFEYDRQGAGCRFGVDQVRQAGGRVQARS